jgi:hypothetical protein
MLFSVKWGTTLKRWVELPTLADVSLPPYRKVYSLPIYNDLAHVVTFDDHWLKLSFLMIFNTAVVYLD